jgi:hypothetical protein
MPCTLVCLTPVIIAAWPSIVECAVGVAAMLGFSAVSSATCQNEATEINTVEIELEGSSVLEGCSGEQLQFSKEDMKLAVRRNERGRISLFAQGSQSKEVLRENATAFIARLHQAYAYHRAMTQLRSSGFNAVSEQVDQNREIHITLRRF